MDFPYQKNYLQYDILPDRKVFNTETCRPDNVQKR